MTKKNLKNVLRRIGACVFALGVAVATLAVDGTTAKAEELVNYYILEDGSIKSSEELVNQQYKNVARISATTKTGIAYDVSTTTITLTNVTLDTVNCSGEYDSVTGEEKIREFTIKFSGTNTCNTLEASASTIAFEAADEKSTLTCAKIVDYSAEMGGKVGDAYNFDKVESNVKEWTEEIMYQMPTYVMKNVTLSYKKAATEEKPTVPVNDSTVSVADDAAALPAGTSMTVAKAESGSAKFVNAQTAVANNGLEVAADKIAVFDMTLKAGNGSEIHDLGGNTVAVTMPVPITLSNDSTMELAVYRVNDDGTLTRCAATVANGKVTFVTNHFSTYVFVEVKKGSQTKPVKAVDTTSGFDRYLTSKVNEINKAADGSKIVITKADEINSLPNTIMHALVVKKTVSLEMNYVYDGQEYTILIPAGGAIDSDIGWYGPLFLAAHYGKGAAPAAAPSAAPSTNAGSVYTIQSGDTLNKIAAKLGTTVPNLMAKNPQIKDKNKIYVGKTLNY